MAEKGDAFSCAESQCIGLLEEGHRFCATCGKKFNREEVFIRHYFKFGYHYEVILAFLSKFHDIKMSLRTLKYGLESFGLTRRSTPYDEVAVRARIQDELDGPGCMSGYRSMWHTLQMEGVVIPRNDVARMLRELDPEGCQERQAKRLKQRAYISTGPNQCWHIDGYDKLKPYGFPIHGCVDGWSRKLLWLHVTRSNNDPKRIGKLYLDTVEKLRGCPMRIRTDHGTENGFVAAAQSYFLDDISAHKYGSSPHNQRIEGWWSFYRRSRSTSWINFFKDLIDRCVFTPGDDLSNECLWNCFASLIQSDLDAVKEHWNSHYIRKLRHDTISGRPNELFFIPELHGGVDCLQAISVDKFQNAKSQLDEVPPNVDLYDDYFDYLREVNGFRRPCDRKEALDQYKTLMQYSRAGNAS